MGHNQKDRLKDYWSKLEQFLMVFYRNTMTLNRFFHVLRFLHFSDNKIEQYCCSYWLHPSYKILKQDHYVSGAGSAPIFRWKHLGVIPCPINTGHKLTFSEVPMVISVPAKFYCIMETRCLTADIQNCQKTCSVGISCLRKSSITCALIEIQSSFYAHFKANKMPFPMTYYAIYSAQLYTQGLKIWPLTLYI
jgi:hypothetical protein